MSFFGRSELGDTDDPTELVPGNVVTLTETADGLRKLSNACQQAYAGLSKLDMSGWTGDAADKFDQYFAKETPKWRDAADAFGPVVDALTTYRGAVERAQRDAAEAVRIYNEAKAATETAEKQYEAAAAQHDKALVAAQFSGDQAPSSPAPFSDPGKAKREEAERLLADARRGLKDAAAQAAAVVAKAKDRAPAEPGFLSKLAATVEDAADQSTTQAASFVEGLDSSMVDLVKAARTSSPVDPYNMSHPGQYAANMLKQASGMVRMASHPGEAIKAVLNVDGWKKDPASALGRLTGDVALAVATDGAGLAGNATKIAAREAMEVGAREAAEIAAREAAEQVGSQVGKHMDDAVPPHMRPDFDPEAHTPDYNPHQDEPFGPQRTEPDAPHDRGEPDSPAQHDSDPPVEETKREPDEQPKVREPEDLPEPDRGHYFQLKESVREISDVLPNLTGPERAAQEQLMAHQQQQMRNIMAKHS